MTTSTSIGASIPANCFSPKGYVKSHPASGLLSTRHGDRLIAVPELLLDRQATRLSRIEDRLGLVDA